jgi:hypothetical protein
MLFPTIAAFAADRKKTAARIANSSSVCLLFGFIFWSPEKLRKDIMTAQTLCLCRIFANLTSALIPAKNM